VLRSKSSLESYGSNAAVLLRPDATIAAVQTSLGYLVTYQVQVDPKTRVYQQIRTDEKAKRMSIAGRLPMHTGQLGQREVHIRFRMVIKIDAGIGKSLAIDDELVVATKKPAAVQCIRWTQDESKSQTSTELLSRVPWMTKSNVTDMVYNRQMNLFVWITSNGHAYAVQKQSETGPKMEGHGKLFKGFPLHAPRTRNDEACRAAINARFSLLAVGCSDGQILVYTARDYSGSLPLSHKCMPPVSFETSGRLTCLIYSPDGYCLFAGYERGWTMWSVFGKIGGSSFSADIDMCKENDEVWLTGCHDASWIDGGTRIMFTSGYDDSIMVLNVAKSAMTGCFVPSNASRMLHHTSSEIMIYRGHDASNITALASDITMWTHVQMPLEFLANQSPIRSAVISSDGRYIAIAGRRGIAHYSIQSGRWKTFDDPHVENSFTVRGGMFWYQHILVTAVETEGHDEVSLMATSTSVKTPDAHTASFDCTHERCH
jgi:WD40 repeat protein